MSKPRKYPVGAFVIHTTSGRIGRIVKQEPAYEIDWGDHRSSSIWYELRALPRRKK